MQVKDGMENITTGNLTREHILQALMTADVNINMKTDIEFPKELAQLETIGLFIKQKGYIKTGKLIIDFCTLYKEMRVSLKRKGRKEIIEALSSMIKEITEKEKFESLFAQLGK